MSKLRIARSAIADLDEIWTYIAKRESLQASGRFLTFLTNKLALLSKNPGLGRSRSDLREGLRSFPVGNYRVYYRQEKEDIVRILYVRHAARDEKKLFE